MTMRVNPEALTSAAEAIGIYVPGNLPLLARKTIARAAVVAYEKERRERCKGRKLGPVSDSLRAMQVGEQKLLPPATISTVYNSMVRARRALEVDAKWRAQVQPDGSVLITRLPDGSALRKPITSPIMLALTQVAVGDSVLVRVKHVGSLDKYYQRAREAMANPGALWSYRTTSLGLRVTRRA